ncbi:uroporphyrin-3 C-methyltransferase [Crenobacter luteus]|uniref:Heme biosynthesis operon protein HemX n=1 Tax=Crenobacter luteus TaxID=1452487 RepID=A0A163D7R7_9NEIS|nr:uroporphyrinogen-III C-methyltransferase [Crenobacter luteus]KZE34071.1 hypothetical protein AVW16_07135 [Crenobacter luteus]TCP09120.1 uroporphyrin-3 C-methyltransferase [Crenobacter luteus]
MSEIPTAASVDPAPPTAKKKPVSLALIVALAALGVTGWQYYETRQELAGVKLALAQKLAESGGAARELRTLTEQAISANRATDAKLARVEEQVALATGQYATLNGMYQELTRGRADWLLSEIEHTLAVASQELQLAGNVSGAIVALEGVNARLDQFNRPQLIGVKRAVARDLEALKALPYLDTVGLSVKLDRLMLAVDSLPLAIDHHRLGPAERQSRAAASAGGWWSQLSGEIAASFGELVRIRRMDKPEALLLSPEQGFFLRENLKLRLLDARIALTQRDASAWRADLTAANTYVQRYFDRDAPSTRRWLAGLAELDNAPLDVKLPDLAASLKAARDAQGPQDIAKGTTP